MNTQVVKENLHQSIDQAFATMDELKNKAAQSTAEFRKTIEGDLQSLEAKKQELEPRMAEWRSAAEHKKDQLTEAVEESADAFRESLERIAAVFSESPSPRK